MLPGFDELRRQADEARQRVPVVAVGAADRSVLEAVRAASERGWIVPTLVGSETEIRGLAASVSIDLDGCGILDTETRETARVGVGEARSGRAQIVMKGQIGTPDLMAAILDQEHGLRTGRAICQVVLMEIPRDARRFLMADTGILIQPTLAQKIDVMKAAVDVARALGTEQPRVAMMAATEKSVESMPETREASELQGRNLAGEFPECVIQGPLSFDLAYAHDAADKKRLMGPVMGAADIMIFPDLAAGNLTVKAIMYTADCRFGGVLRGTSCPVAFMSRADTTATRLDSLALALRLVATNQ